MARSSRWLMMCALLLLAPLLLYVGFVLPIALSPFTGLSESTMQILRASGALVAALYVAAFAATLARRVALALKLTALTVAIQLAGVAIVVVAEPIFREREREVQIQERFDAAAAAHPTQVWCNGGFAYLRQDADEIGYDVMLHRPPSEGEFALRIAQFRASEEHGSCDATLFAEPYAVARRWFDTCPSERDAFESLVDRVRHPTTCPWPTIHWWPKDPGTR